MISESALPVSVDMLSIEKCLQSGHSQDSRSGPKEERWTLKIHTWKHTKGIGKQSIVSRMQLVKLEDGQRLLREYQLIGKL